MSEEQLVDRKHKIKEMDELIEKTLGSVKERSCEKYCHYLAYKKNLFVPWDFKDTSEESGLQTIS